MAGETWRRELQPFGVRVITLSTSAVKSNAPKNFRPMTLPENSLYDGLQSFLNRGAGGEMQKKAITPSQYAAQVFRAVEQGASGVVWAGTDSFSIKMAYTLLPTSVLVSKG